jgi:hypothetical protein
MSGDDLHPFDRLVRALQDHGCRPRVTGHQARALCPNHRDVRPSLGVKRREHDIIFNCFFCGKPGKPAILRALGLTGADLYDGPRVPEPKASIQTTYDYIDLNGVFVAQKVRMTNKDFWWRRPDPHAKSGWRNDRKGVSVGLYRLRDCIDMTTVYLTEGEKSVDRLWSLGLPTTSGPDGAKTWTTQWSMSLWTTGCRELIILPDRDQAGEHHAELVAGITSALEVDDLITVKVVRLPDLADKADVFDYLESGHDADDLRAVVAETPVWTPDHAERDRLARRRLLDRNRQRRCRAKAVMLRMSEPGPVTLRTLGLMVVTQRMLEPVTLGAVTLASSADNSLPCRLLQAVTHSERSSITLQEPVSRDLGTQVVVPRDPAPVVVPLGHDLRSDEERHLAQRDFVAPMPPQGREALQGVAAGGNRSVLNARQASARSFEPGEWDSSSDVLWNEKELTGADRPLSTSSNPSRGAR